MGFKENYPDQSVMEDEQCINCKKNPLAGTLPTTVIVKLVLIMVLSNVAFFSLGMFFSHFVFS